MLLASGIHQDYDLFIGKMFLFLFKKCENSPFEIETIQIYKHSTVYIGKDSSDKGELKVWKFPLEYLTCRMLDFAPYFFISLPF